MRVAPVPGIPWITRANVALKHIDTAAANSAAAVWLAVVDLVELFTIVAKVVVRTCARVRPLGVHPFVCAPSPVLAWARVTVVLAGKTGYLGARGTSELNLVAV